jgi:hypothetical protein
LEEYGKSENVFGKNGISNVQFNEAKKFGQLRDQLKILKERKFSDKIEGCYIQLITKCYLKTWKILG